MLNLKNFSKRINILLNRSHYINKIIVDEGHYNYSVNLKLADLVLARACLFLLSVTLRLHSQVKSYPRPGRGKLAGAARPGASPAATLAGCYAEM